MEPKKFDVIDNDTKNLIASGMDLDVALMFIEAYIHKFWNESCSLIIEEA